MTGEFDLIDPGTVLSRRALIDVIVGLSEHLEALTVLGGHAVIEMTWHLDALPVPDTTQDGDLGVAPQLLADSPLLFEKMTELGFEAARTDRPGIWSPIEQRDLPPHEQASVDLIAPRAVAAENIQRPIRAARVGAHGKHSVSATEGTELSLLDRRLAVLRSFDTGPGVQAYVAGPAALLCAKAYKLHDRMEPTELRRNRERLRPKDFADVYRLLHAISGEEAARVFEQGAADERIGTAVGLGRDHLIELLRDPSAVAGPVAESWAAPELEDEMTDRIRFWLERFQG
ncbi:hypothetical protein [Brevibacterium casei]|uniref:hypothetical protein n=1 Tax=Brevibacterium casei TaxID=33889 RepID=UPI00223B3A4B|nr:hypothetical protein [Brevibacterium casei]MCT1549658.1 hypothetical protein [Brevibacterium casei]MCT1559195.1 hypothetical protein [Brevibacterium casei]MCT2207623.1 hypothetical protein [Brevibacterium casei]